MTITESRQGPFYILKVTDRIDASTAPDFQEKAVELIKAGEQRIIIDLSEIEHVSSPGLRVFLILAQSLEQSEGKLAVVCEEDYIMEIFLLSGLASCFPLASSVEEAQAQIE